MMRIEVEIDESMLARAAKVAFEQAYSSDTQRYSSEREGFIALKRQIVGEVGVWMGGAGNQMIRDTVARLMPAIIEDIVAADLRKRIKAQHDAMRKAGELLEPKL